MGSTFSFKPVKINFMVTNSSLLSNKDSRITLFSDTVKLGFFRAFGQSSISLSRIPYIESKKRLIGSSKSLDLIGSFPSFSILIMNNQLSFAVLSNFSLYL